MTTDLTDLTDPIVTGSDVVSTIKGFETEKDPDEITRGFRDIQEYVTNSTNPEEIAEIIADIYNSKKHNKLTPLCFLMDLGIREMTTENGIFTKDNNLKENAKDIFLALDKRRLTPKIMYETYEEWKNNREYAQDEEKGGTKVLKLILHEDEFSKNRSTLVLLQKKIINESQDLISKNSGNSKRVIEELVNSLGRTFKMEEFDSSEISEIIFLLQDI